MTRTILPMLGLSALLFAGSPPLGAQDGPSVVEDDPFTALLAPGPDESIPENASAEDVAFAALEAAREEKFVRARELVETVLRDEPTAWAPRIVLGMVLHRGEGNLPRALYHLERARRDFEEEWGEIPASDAPWFWHAMNLAELAFVNGSMGRHEEKVRLLRERDSLYDPPWPADRGWPLMRLRRYDEARQAVAEALQLEDQPEQIAAARTALCAIEAEQHRRAEAYVACVAAAEAEREWPEGGPTPFTNAAEASLGMLRPDEAERWILEGTERFAYGTVSNPWLDLTELYLATGRTSEALDALRRMFRWRHRQPAYMDEQNRAETQMTSAVFLLVAGRLEQAARATARIVDRPDRTGFTSSESGQMEAAAALIDRAAHRAAAEVAAERASWSPWREAPRWSLLAAHRRLRTWTSGRRAAALVADRRRLVSTVRPYLAGSVEIPEWLAPELVGAAGPGVVAAALADAREVETLPDAEGYFLAWESEIEFHRGRWRRCLEVAERALEQLPGSEVLLRARVAVRGARAAEERGEAARSLALLDLALQLDRSTVRRLGESLPVAIEASPGIVPETVADLLSDSPRFRDVGTGFRVQVTGDGSNAEACLLDPAGSRVACARTRLSRAGEDDDDLARRLAEEFHDAAFSPRIDLTQADLQSLDGSPTAGGGRAAERFQRVLDGLVGAD